MASRNREVQEGSQRGLRVYRYRDFVTNDDIRPEYLDRGFSGITVYTYGSGTYAIELHLSPIEGGAARHIRAATITNTTPVVSVAHLGHSFRLVCTNGSAPGIDVILEVKEVDN